MHEHEHEHKYEHENELGKSRQNRMRTVRVRYHCGGWSEELNSRILLLAYMVYL
jgi:hypothetical protein